MTDPTHTFLDRARRPAACALLLSSLLGYGVGCDDSGSYASQEQPASTQTALSKRIGPEGGTLRGEPGGAFEDVEIHIPKGALDEQTEIQVVRLDEGEKDLPEGAVPCGPMFAIEPLGLVLSEPAEVKLPFDDEIVEAEMRFADEVKVWIGTDEGWGREEQFDSTADTVSVALAELTTVAAGVRRVKPEDIVTFRFEPIESVVPCMAKYPDDPKRKPYIEALVVAGEGNDTMFVYGENFKPGIGFDLFSLQNSLLDAEGARDAEFAGFGLGWYQTDLEADHWGRVRQAIRTVLLDEAFGLSIGDPALAPTRTFHAGFWFTDPADAFACGFEEGKTTPFNGEQKAGPLAMITLPDAETGLGPLCTDAETCLAE